MTGVNMVVYNSTYKELLSLNITDTIQAGTNIPRINKKLTQK